MLGMKLQKARTAVLQDMHSLAAGLEVGDHQKKLQNDRLEIKNIYSEVF